jgi:hypothetical protein
MAAECSSSSWNGGRLDGDDARRLLQAAARAGAVQMLTDFKQGRAASASRIYPRPAPQHQPADGFLSSTSIERRVG